MNDVTEILNIMNSDFKLWERAETQDLGGGKVLKTITLPWGIGVTEVTLEGMTDAEKRRQAVGAYGEYIRSVIDERINDEAITARAKQAAARAQPADSPDSDSVSADEGLRDERLQEETYEGAGPKDKRDAQDIAGIGADLIARRTALRERVGRVEADLTRWRRELKALDAAVAALEEDDDTEDD